MNKVIELIKPYLSIVFGFLLFLYYFNYLQYSGILLAIGIIAVFISLYYLVHGILNLFLNDKIKGGKDILNLVSLSLFPLFIFFHLIVLIVNNSNIFGPTSWVIVIFGLLTSLAFPIFAIIAHFVKNKTLSKLSYLFNFLFFLGLLLSIFFNMSGNAIRLGDLDFIYTLIILCFFFLSVEVLVEKPMEKSEKPEVSDEESHE